MKALLIFKKIAMSIVTALFVSFACFAIIHNAPGDPARILLRQKNPTGGLDQRTVEMYAEKLGSDKGFLQQYLDWLGGALKGDLGFSYRTSQPVLEEFTSRFGCTLLLLALSILIALVIGVVFGLLAAKYHNRAIDYFSRVIAVFNMSVPTFWLALIFLWIFSVKLHMFPSFGFDGLKSLVLPSLALGLGYSSSFLRVTRICALDSMASGYVTTARAKGIGEMMLLFRHVLKNIFIPILTIMGNSVISLIGGSVIIESIFGLTGIGNYLIQAITSKDYPVVLGFVFIIGLMVIVINLIVDAGYILIDPRVRQGNYEKG